MYKHVHMYQRLYFSKGIQSGQLIGYIVNYSLEIIFSAHIFPKHIDKLQNLNQPHKKGISIMMSCFLSRALHFSVIYFVKKDLIFLKKYIVPPSPVKLKKGLINKYNK